MESTARYLLARFSNLVESLKTATDNILSLTRRLDALEVSPYSSYCGTDGTTAAVLLGDGLVAFTLVGDNFSGGSFVCPAAGTYYCSGSTSLSTDDASSSQQLQLLKNGGWFMTGHRADAVAVWDTILVHGKTTLAVGDTVTMSISNSDASSGSLHGGTLFLQKL